VGDAHPRFLQASPRPAGWCRLCLRQREHNSSRRVSCIVSLLQAIHVSSSRFSDVRPSRAFGSSSGSAKSPASTPPWPHASLGELEVLFVFLSIVFVL
jgi:hypothetical protein